MLSKRNQNKWPKSCYSLNSLGKCFLIVASLLLALILIIFFKDYNNEWKTYQKEFRKFESAQTKELLDQEVDKLKTASELKKAGRDVRVVEVQKNVLEGKLKKVDLGSMDVQNNLGSIVGDLPVLDMLNPYDKIDRRAVKDIKGDLHFSKVLKVELCTSCHKGIMKKGYENMPQPDRTHPNLELYLSSESPHPIQGSSCTSCHQGRGQGTSFQSSVHTPNSPEQAKEWKEKYDWHPMAEWDQPMLPKKHIEASCLQCHSPKTSIKGAEKLNLGLRLIAQSGCDACHKMDKFASYDRPGPNLKKMADKLTTDTWIYHWIHDPKSFRHNTWMPSYFNLANNSNAESVRRGEQEIHAIKAFLYEKSKTYDMEEIPVKGDPVKGEELLAGPGCSSCHQVQSGIGQERNLTLKDLTREQGPNLLNMGSKTNAKWLFNWLKEPQSYHPATTMPDMRLSDQEAADITSYLMSQTDKSLGQKNVPDLDHKILDQITLDFMNKVLTEDQSKEKLTQMSIQEKQFFSGEKLVNYYGCASCHEVEGMEDALPIGGELNGIASKTLHQFDFGFRHDIPHTKHDWLFNKIKNPRGFDHGKILNPLEKLIMPDFGFSDSEAEAITTALMGLVKVDSSVKMPE